MTERDDRQFPSGGDRPAAPDPGPAEVEVGPDQHGDDNERADDKVDIVKEPPAQP